MKWIQNRLLLFVTHPLVLHPMRTSGAIGGEWGVHSFLQWAELHGLPHLPVQMFGIFLEVMLFLLLVKWSIEGVRDIFQWWKLSNGIKASNNSGRQKKEGTAKKE